MVGDPKVRVGSLHQEQLSQFQIARLMKEAGAASEDNVEGSGGQSPIIEIFWG